MITYAPSAISTSGQKNATPLNPIHDFKVLYGTATLRLDENGEVARVGGVRWVVKDGVVYDAPALLRDVEAMVAAAKRAGVATGATR